MKILFALLISITSASLFDPKIGGTIDVTDRRESLWRREGVLLIEALTGAPSKVFARTRVINPTFPQAFLIGPKNTLVPGAPFEGPFQLRIKMSNKKGDVLYQALLGRKVPFNKGQRRIQVKLTPL